MENRRGNVYFYTALDAYRLKKYSPPSLQRNLVHGIYEVKVAGELPPDILREYYDI